MGQWRADEEGSQGKQGQKHQAKVLNQVIITVTGFLCTRVPLSFLLSVSVFCSPADTSAFHFIQKITNVPCMC